MVNKALNLTLRNYWEYASKVTELQNRINELDSQMDHVSGGIVKVPEGGQDGCKLIALISSKSVCENAIKDIVYWLKEVDSLQQFAKGKSGQIVTLRKGGESVKNICRELNISRQRYHEILTNVVKMYLASKEETYAKANNRSY